MGIRIKLATTPAEIDGVFRLRHQVFVEEEGYMVPRADRRMFDRYDTLPTARLVIAKDGEAVIGAMRVIEDSVAGTLPDEFFDFSPYMPDDAGRTGAVTTLCVARAYRKVPGLTFALMAMTYYQAIDMGLTHVKGVSNPDCLSMYEYTGWKVIAPLFHDEEHGVDSVPAMLDLRQLSDRFSKFIRSQKLEHFMQSFEREFYQPGECVVRAGEEGHEMFVVVDGRAGVTLDDPAQVASPKIVREFGPGEIFGEIAVLTARPRTANIVALSELNVMVLDRAEFEAQVIRDPMAALQMLRVLGDRLADNLKL